MLMAALRSHDKTYVCKVKSLSNVWKNLGDGRSISFIYFQDYMDYMRGIIMKPTSILKNPAARSVVFASFMIFSIVNVSHAQTGSAEQHSSGWGDTPPSQGNSLRENSGPAPAGQGKPTQPGSPPGWSSAGQGSGSCRHATPDQESFLCKAIRIFYGPDTPPGPNRDVDDNISAGGAGG